MEQIRLWLLRLVIGGLLVVLSLWTFPQTAQASLHTYFERPGQVTYRSRQSLRDSQDRAWQAVAFTRWQGDTVQEISLRLVGFPGLVTLTPALPVTLVAPTGEQWRLPRRTDDSVQMLPASAGQYDLQPFLRNLGYSLPLKLQISLVGEPAVTLAIAPYIVDEWLQLKTTAPPSP